MLTELRIAGLGVIAETSLELSGGLTAITGETGAGKTMVVNGLELLLGARSDVSVVRHGSSRALVEGRFLAGDLESRVHDLGGEIDDDLLISRQVARAGRSRAMVGGAQVTITQLAELSAELVTVHSQNEQIRLGSPERQRDVLDRYCGADHQALLARCRDLHQRLRAVRIELAALVNRSQERAREEGMLRFGIDEITAIDPRPGEDDQLTAESERLQSIDELRSHAEVASAALSGNVQDPDQPDAVALVGEARKALEHAGRHDPAAEQLVSELQEVSFALDEVAGQVASYLADLESDPTRLEQVMSRRAELAKLTRKYGTSISEVLHWLHQSTGQLDRLTGSDERIDQLRMQAVRLAAELDEVAQSVSRGRRLCAERLQSAVGAELTALAMPHGRLVFDLEPLDEPGPHGAEQVRLLFSANPGSAPAAVAKVASGGELSRIRLALEVVLADSDPGHTFVFDEVDAGVGGSVALEIGRRLSLLAKHSQVIVVTHLAQVAAHADRQVVISKSTDGEVTSSDLRVLTDVERPGELARMMAGLADSDEALAHAAELLVAAKAPR